MPRFGARAVVADAAMTEWQTSNRKGLTCGTPSAVAPGRDGAAVASAPTAASAAVPVTGQPEYSPTNKQRSEILTWLAGGHTATQAVRERRAAGPTFGELAGRWRAGVENGSIAKRRGRYRRTRAGRDTGDELAPSRARRSRLGRTPASAAARHPVRMPAHLRVR